MKSEVLEKAGKKVVLLGNEAIARGALEAGVGAVTAYPGTPSSEVPAVLSRPAKDLGFYLEYSTNEKAALEAAAGAAWSGVRALVAMKHFGLNVASDSLMPIAYTGVKAGLVIMVADDPQAYSSVQSEQDSRFYARLAKLPMLEPANPQECLEFTKLAFGLSEEFEIPILLRTTTKVSHSIGTVTLGELGEIKSRGQFEKDPARFYNFRPQLQELHRRLNEKIEQLENRVGKGLQELSSCRGLNTTFPGDGEIGIITSSVSFEYVKEAVKELGINPPIAKLGLTHPISKEFIDNFIRDKKTVLVVEELEPIVENFAKQRRCLEARSIIEVHGKDLLPRVGEYNLEIVIAALKRVFEEVQTSTTVVGRVCSTTEFDFARHKKRVEEVVAGLPPRKPVFCPGCPHRSTFYAVKKVFPNAVYAGDIGCYMMGAFEPFKMQDFIISMGAGLGLAHGISRVSDQEVVAFVGDSTFFHAGMPEILNYKFNDENSPLVVVMDNDITAMTGLQPHPGSGFTAIGEKTEPAKIEDVARAFGAEVKVASAFNQKRLVEALEELRKVKGSKVLVSRGECRLLTKRKLRKKGISFSTFKVVDSAEFGQSGLMEEFACPAFQKDNGNYSIDPDLCWGCGVCSQICPKGVKKK